MSESGDLVGHWWTQVRFLDSAENDVITAVDRRLSSWGKNFQESLETGHGNDDYIDSGELVLESL